MIRIPTRDLVGLLTDLALTAADPASGEATASVLLHTARGYAGDEPGEVDLLVGTSTDRLVIGHAHAQCYGQTAAPMLWPIRDVQAALGVLKTLYGKAKEHAVTITIEDREVVLSEDPDLFGEGASFRFTPGDAGDFPDAPWRALAHTTARPPDGSEPAAPRTDYVASRLAPFLKAASRRGEIMQTFRWHQSLPVHVQIGPAYRGVVSPYVWHDEDASAAQGPGGDVYPLPVDLFAPVPA